MNKFGVHESISNGIEEAIDAAVERKCQALQIFQKPKQSYWFDKDFDKRNQGVADKLQLSELVMAVHASYFINLISQKPRIRKLSVSSLIQELDKASFLGADYLVLHPGSVGVKGDRTTGLKLLCDSLRFVLAENDFSTQLLLETMPGAGGQIGGDFEQLAEMCHQLWSEGLKFGICFDSCHAFVAGYDFQSDSSKYLEFWNLWNDFIGIGNIKLFHVNGAFFDFGSKKDGHASLDGIHNAKMSKSRDTPSINPEFFKWLVKDPRFAEIAGILETPVENWDIDLTYIRGCAETPSSKLG